MVSLKNLIKPTTANHACYSKYCHSLTSFRRLNLVGNALCIVCNYPEKRSLKRVKVNWWAKSYKNKSSFYPEAYKYINAKWQVLLLRRHTTYKWPEYTKTRSPTSVSSFSNPVLVNPLNQRFCTTPIS